MAKKRILLKGFKIFEEKKNGDFLDSILLDKSGRVALRHVSQRVRETCSVASARYRSGERGGSGRGLFSLHSLIGPVGR